MQPSDSDGPLAPITDPEIADFVRANLDRDDRLSDPRTVGAVVVNGVVTLSGTVPSEAQTRAATQDGWDAPGVVDVIDEVVIVPVVARADPAIAADVLDALAHDPAVDAHGILVSVVRATVYLDGTVPAHDQVQRAADDARGVVGVVNAVNRLSAAS